MIRFQVLGTVDLRQSDGTVIASVLAQPKRLALLAFLTLAHTAPLRRDTLLGMFWPDADEEHARSALSQALHFLRRSLGDDALVRRGESELGLNHDRIRCDAVAFRAAAERGQHESAMAEYRGELLPGLIVPGASGFQDWLDRQRAELCQLAARSAWSLAGAARKENRKAAALEWATRGLSLSPDDEAGLRQAIELYRWTGDRAGAIRVYEEFAARVRSQYGIAPAAETAELIAAVRPARDKGPIPDPAPTGIAESPPGGLPKDQLAPGLAPGSLGPKPTHRWLRIVGASTLVGMLLVAGVVLKRSPSSADSTRQVSIRPFDNRTGDSTYDRLGALVADWLVQSLLETGVAPVLSRVEAGNARHRGSAVRGTIYLQGDSLLFQAVIQDGSTGAIQSALLPVSVSVRDPISGVDVVRRRVLASLAALYDPRLRTWSAVAGQPPTYEAYLEFVQGREIWASNYRRALAHFYAAATLDTSYSLALIEAAAAHRMLGECARTDSIAALVRPRRLTPHDRLFLETQVAACQGDRARVYVLTRDRFRLTPGSAQAAYGFMLAALNVNRLAEALAAVERVDLEQGGTEVGANFYQYLALLHHRLGQHERELEVAQAGRRRFPDAVQPLKAEVFALAALGRGAELTSRFHELEAFPRQSEPPPELTMAWVAAELRAHGHETAVGDVVQQVLARTGRRVEGPDEEILDDWSLQTLYLIGDWKAAFELAQRLVHNRSNHVVYRGWLGITSARTGDSATAASSDAWLAARDQPYDHSRWLWRARIAALLGNDDDALKFLSHALATVGYIGTNLHCDPDFERLRHYPAFRALERPRDSTA